MNEGLFGCHKFKIKIYIFRKNISIFPSNWLEYKDVYIYIYIHMYMYIYTHMYIYIYNKVRIRNSGEIFLVSTELSTNFCASHYQGKFINNINIY